MEHIKQITFEEGIRLIGRYCKAKRRINNRVCQIILGEGGLA